MRNIKKLLVPIDFSPESEKSLRYASSLASEFDAELVALYVVEDILEEGILAYTFPPEGYGYWDAKPSPRPLDALLNERALDLFRFKERIIGNKAVRIKTIVRLGKIHTEIATAAREENIDLIVVELRRRFLFSSPGRRRLLRTIDKLPYPVLLPPPMVEEAPRRGRRIFAYSPVLSTGSAA